MELVATCICIFTTLQGNQIYNGNWTEWSAICIGNHMIPSAIWNKWARVKFSKANKIARARRASAICGLLKFYKCSFIPNCTRKIMWLLVNNIHTKISNELLFISCLSANAPPTCIWLVSKMTTLIDIHVYTYGKHAKNTISLKRTSFQITKQTFKSMLKEVWSQSPFSACFRTDWISGAGALQTVQTGVF